MFVLISTKILQFGQSLTLKKLQQKFISVKFTFVKLCQELHHPMKSYFDVYHSGKLKL